jgi:predicted DNA-binding antitoxin AbrB/MazE fold protein
VIEKLLCYKGLRAMRIHQAEKLKKLLTHSTLLANAVNKKNRKEVIMQVIVLNDVDLKDGEMTNIGVCTSNESAENIMKDYYGEYEELEHTQVSESGLEWIKIIMVDDIDEQSKEECKIVANLFIVDNYI